MSSNCGEKWCLKGTKVCTLLFEFAKLFLVNEPRRDRNKLEVVFREVMRGSYADALAFTDEMIHITKRIDIIARGVGVVNEDSVLEVLVGVHDVAILRKGLPYLLYFKIDVSEDLRLLFTF